jgi:predicted DNA repair protein MutK
MPKFMAVLSVVGTAAMIWVGGGIIVHGLAAFGLDSIEHFIEDIAHAVAAAVPAIEGFITWAVNAFGSGVLGLVLGALLIPVAEHVIAPATRAVKGMIKKEA